MIYVFHIYNVIMEVYWSAHIEAIDAERGYVQAIKYSSIVWQYRHITIDLWLLSYNKLIPTHGGMWPFS